MSTEHEVVMAVAEQLEGESPMLLDPASGFRERCVWFRKEIGRPMSEQEYALAEAFYHSGFGDGSEQVLRLWAEDELIPLAADAARAEEGS